MPYLTGNIGFSIKLKMFFLFFFIALFLESGIGFHRLPQGLRG